MMNYNQLSLACNKSGIGIEIDGIFVPIDKSFYTLSSEEQIIFLEVNKQLKLANLLELEADL